MQWGFIQQLYLEPGNPVDAQDKALELLPQILVLSPHNPWQILTTSVSPLNKVINFISFSNHIASLVRGAQKSGSILKVSASLVFNLAGIIVRDSYGI